MEPKQIFDRVIASDGKQYNKSEETQLCYHIDTPMSIMMIIERAFINRTRLVFDFGDIKTGRSWGEVYDIKGTIGRSTGAFKIPLLVHNARSLGGGGLLTHCIVKITESKGGKEIYKHKTYNNEILV